jgi:small subunit ribosomal protein S1
MSRAYQSIPQPEPDEDYWAALLAEEPEVPPSLEIAEFPLLGGDSSLWKPEASMGARASNNGLREDWQRAYLAQSQDQTLELEVVGFNKGGLLVQWGHLRGFVPSSQLVESLTRHLSAPQQLESYVGRRIYLRIIELDESQNRLIFSERAAQVQPGTRASLFQNLTPASRWRGVVTNVCDFGVFVDIGGIEGLIHISELSWGRVEHPSEILHRGQEIQVHIMEVYPDKGRVALSLKRLSPDPWETVEQRYRVNQMVTVTVTSVVDFGAFASLEEGLEGLIHVSEMAEGQFLHPRNVVSEGQTVTVRILNIDHRVRRIGLSLRHATTPET